MKKTLLTIAGALLFGASTMAQAPIAEALPAQPAATNAPMRAPTNDGYEIKFCNNINTFNKMSSRSKTSYRVYMYITPEIATKLAGNELTSVTFAVAYTGATKSRAATIFVTEDIEGESIAVKEFTSVNNYNSNTAMNTAEFDTPYTIKEGQGFYFGYTVANCSSDDYPIAVSTNLNDFAGMVDIYNSNGENVDSYDAGSALGVNIYLTANTVGEKKELNNFINIALNNATFDLPVAKVGESIEPKITISNLGSNKIKSINYVVDNGSGELTEGKLTTNVNTLKSSSYKVPVANLGAGRQTVTVKVTAINDEASDLSAECGYIGLNGEGYDRKFVVEEGTGTWCGWCPRGIVGLDTMEENHPDSFIGIGVHSGDKFEVASYGPLINKFFDGFPTCVVNRDKNFKLDPSASTLETAFKKWAPQAAPAEVTITEALIAEDGSNVKVTTNTTFAYSEENAQYRLAYSVLEDGLRASQQNYYAGGGSGAMGGWEKKGNTVVWTYTNTARNIYDCWGLEESVPTTITEGEAIEYAYEVSMAKVTDTANSIIIVMLLDARSGVVLNAAKIKASDYTTGINDVISDTDAPAEYYNIQGIRMDGNNLPAGMYIIKRGDKVTKSVIR